MAFYRQHFGAYLFANQNLAPTPISSHLNQQPFSVFIKIAPLKKAFSNTTFSKLLSQKTLSQN